MKNSKIHIGFKSKNQYPLFMILKEYYEDGEIVYVKVIVMIDSIYDLFKWILPRR